MFVPTWEGKRPIPVVSACMTRDGLPTFAMNTVEVTAEEAADGIHLYLVEADLLESGLEEPFVHFPTGEAPAFLHPAVRAHLSLAPTRTESILVTGPEGQLIARIIEVVALKSERRQLGVEAERIAPT